MEEIKPKKAKSLTSIRKTKIERLDFTNQFYDAFGLPQNRGVWFIWGGSGSGKSSLVMQTIKELARNDDVLYNLLEEDPDDASFIERLETFKMHEVEDRVKVGQYTPEELRVVLRRRNSAKVVVIDSLIYFTRTFDEYLSLKKEFKDKVFIYTGHARGANPREEIEMRVMYDAYMKIRVDAYAAYCKGRSIGSNGGTYIIWDKKYKELMGNDE